MEGNEIHLIPSLLAIKQQGYKRKPPIKCVINFSTFYKLTSNEF